jgi:DNA-binding NarL/FixJ family response regulator
MTLTIDTRDRAPIRVLLVDDHRMFTELMTVVLSEHPDLEVTGSATDGDEAIERAAADPPDVVVVDYQLPGADGITVAHRFRRELPRVRVVMLTGRNDDALVRAAIDAGCAGFVCKDRAAQELVAAVRTVRDGNAALPPDTVNRLAGSAPAQRQIPFGLTSRELEVVELLAEGASTRELADRLYISLNTARNHVQRAIRKLGAHSRLEAVAIAARAGLVRTDRG